MGLGTICFSHVAFSLTLFYVLLLGFLSSLRVWVQDGQRKKWSGKRQGQGQGP